jgi:hypothetical protein
MYQQLAAFRYNERGVILRTYRRPTRYQNNITLGCKELSSDPVTLIRDNRTTQGHGSIAAHQRFEHQ